MSDCVVVQPIAAAGLDMLRHASLSVHTAPTPSLEAMRPHLSQALGVITRNEGFSAKAIEAAPRLRVIVSHGTGTNRIDKAAAAARDIAVVSTPGTNAISVAEHALALMLACARCMMEADTAIRDGNWAFREQAYPIELAGRTLGLVGYGRIAAHLARLALGIGMEVAAFSRHASADELARQGVRGCEDLNTLLRQSDVVSLHGLAGAKPLLDAQRLSLLRPDAIVINTARGALIDEAALAGALRDGRIATAGLDVFTSEPISGDDPLFDCPNLILTPHMGGSAVEALERTAIAAATKLIEALDLPVPG